MSPNAMANSKSQQTAQLNALLSSSTSKLKATEDARDHLIKAVAAVESLGKIPQITDVHKIASAIKHLALAQIVSADLNINTFSAEVETINNAIASINSPILKVGING